MTDWAEELRRVRAWYDKLVGDKPDPIDTEFVVRLGVEDIAALQRLLWADVVSLARHVPDILDAKADREQPQAEPDPPAAREETPDTPPSRRPSPDAASESPPSNEDPRRAAVIAYVAAQREADPKLTWDEPWIDRLLNDHDQVLSELPAKLGRQHGGPLKDLLGASTPQRSKDVAGPVDVVGYDASPQVKAHDAERSITFEGSTPDLVVANWPPAPKHTCFLLIAGFEDTIPLLFEGRHVGKTFDPQLADEVGLVQTRRQYAVWAYLGDDEASARSATPVLWARGVAMPPVRDVEITIAGDDVTGTWKAGGDPSHVEVFRLLEPHEWRSDRVPGKGRLESGPDHFLSGFEDRDLPAGDYEYRFYSCASADDGTLLRSASVVERQAIVVPVPEVRDLQVVPNLDKTMLTITWTPPAVDDCEVRIHCLYGDVPDAISERELEAEALARQGFKLGAGGSQLAISPKEREGLACIDYPWPDGVHELHFYAVTRIGKNHRVSSSVVVTRVGAAFAEHLEERVDEQYLIFGWPPGADFVEVRYTLDQSPGPTSTWTPVGGGVIVRGKHERHGGIHLEPLPPQGCWLSITGLVNDGDDGDDHTRGETVRIRYPGLTRIVYSITRDQRDKRTVVRSGWKRRTTVETSPERWTVTAVPDRDIDVKVVLARRSDRLPLHHGEKNTDILGELRLHGRANEEVTLWSGLRPGVDLHGYVRVFVSAPPQEQLAFAVLDPAMGELTWGHAP